MLRALGSIVALLIVAACMAANEALAWSNGPAGPDSFGTHDWVLQEAVWQAGKRGAWVRLRAALPHTDDPDSLFHDYYYHVYDEWGGRYGDAPRKVALYYRRALNALRAGQRGRASRMLGIMAHYYADVCNPLHTDQTGAEERMHSAYETSVQELTDSPGERRRWLPRRKRRLVADAEAVTMAAARAAHPSYHALVTNFNRFGMNRTVMRITRRSLGRAVSGLADFIVTLRRDAARARAAQSVRVAPRAGEAPWWVCR